MKQELDRLRNELTMNESLEGELDELRNSAGQTEKESLDEELLRVEALCNSVEVGLASSSKRKRSEDGGEATPDDDDDGAAAEEGDGSMSSEQLAQKLQGEEDLAAAQRHEAEQRSKMARTMPSPGGAGAGQIDLSDASIHAFLELNFEAVGNLAALLDERDEAEDEEAEAADVVEGQPAPAPRPRTSCAAVAAARRPRGLSVHNENGATKRKSEETTSVPPLDAAPAAVAGPPEAVSAPANGRQAKKLHVASDDGSEQSAPLASQMQQPSSRRVSVSAAAPDADSLLPMPARTGSNSRRRSLSQDNSSGTSRRRSLSQDNSGGPSYMRRTASSERRTGGMELPAFEEEVSSQGGGRRRSSLLPVMSAAAGGEKGGRSRRLSSINRGSHAEGHAGNGKPQLNARVKTPVGAGMLRFRGKTEFAEGEWVGVELDAPSACPLPSPAQPLCPPSPPQRYQYSRTYACMVVCMACAATPQFTQHAILCAEGRHDGTVKGRSYFKCPVRLLRRHY